MLKTQVLGSALVLATVGPPRAGESIEVEKLRKPDLTKAIDDAIISFQGRMKTKAQLRNDWLASHTPPDAAQTKARLSNERAKGRRKRRPLMRKRVDAEFKALKTS